MNIFGVTVTVSRSVAIVNLIGTPAVSTITELLVKLRPIGNRRHVGCFRNTRHGPCFRNTR